MTKGEQKNRAQKYINRIKNPNKKRYAIAYFKFITEHKMEPDDPKYDELSYMAAQSVRLHLLDVLSIYYEEVLSRDLS